MEVLGVEVDPALLSSWERWLAPHVQPFFVDSLRDWPKGVPNPGPLPLELVDTYKVYRLVRPWKVLWLDEAAFLRMPRSRRAELVRLQVTYHRCAVPTVRRWQAVLDASTLRAQADGHRFVWWPSLLAPHAAEVLPATVAEADLLPSRHTEVAERTWARCADVVPGARELAGTVARSSGPNCFGTVLGAVGVKGAEARTVIEPFVAWLEGACERGGSDDDPGTVLVWRNTGGAPHHAAITIGDGWALEKASQDWSAPRTILRVNDVIRTNRSRQRHLERHRIVRRRPHT